MDFEFKLIDKATGLEDREIDDCIYLEGGKMVAPRGLEIIQSVGCVDQDSNTIFIGDIIAEITHKSTKLHVCGDTGDPCYEIENIGEVRYTGTMRITVGSSDYGDTVADFSNYYIVGNKYEPKDIIIKRIKERWHDNVDFDGYEFRSWFYNE